MAPHKFIYTLICYLVISETLICAKIKLDKIRGVNLGGWLVLEPWITPSLFQQFENKPFELKAIDETTFQSKLGYQEAQRQLELHWANWVTEEDFRKLSKWGVNLVRIPFGFWVFGDFADMVASIHHLDRGVELAAKYNIQVLLDLHTVPGSQNGFDNSGTACANSQFSKKCVTLCPQDFYWHKHSEYLKKTQEVLVKISDRYKSNSNIFGIELLNEPFLTIDLDFMKNFYEETYTLLRKSIPIDWVVVMHDSFRAWNWKGFMSDQTKFQNVNMDTHIYFAFDENIMKLTPDQILLLPCESQKQIAYMMQNQIPAFVGEWSLAQDDCALWLTGFQQPTRKESILKQTCTKNDDLTFLTTFIKNQLWAWEQSKGWIFWNFKADQDDWSFLTLIQRGVLPENAQGIPSFISDSQCIKTKSLRFLD